MQALPSRLAVDALARASVLAVCAAARHPSVDAAHLDLHRIAAAYRSDRQLTIDGRSPDVWSPLSGFWRSSDGWVRTHANYPHHARALRRALHLSDDAEADALASALSERSTVDAVTRVTEAGGLAVPVLEEDPAADLALREHPLVVSEPTGQAAVRRLAPEPGLAGVRVLDLTRVIAGPVCTRTLALLGADVLRVDPPGIPEPGWQHLDTGHAKRSTILHAASARFEELLSAADVIVLGYRPSALDRLGLSRAALAERHPDLIVAQLSAWGLDHPERRGFDSLVQAESGIALIESPDGERPGALPAQALDHSAGYLLAAAICDAFHDRRTTGVIRTVRTSLRRVAAELLGMPRTADPEPAAPLDPTAHTQRFRVGAQNVVTVRSAIPGLEFDAPRQWGRDPATW
ncbi:CoA transferase [Microbacterium sp. NPDC056234]|uniref:CoA transferase n=1 Tax=Microbacterium sp. NPDC056234 TaxID=3345757 RepID=UPI0035D84F77